MASLDTLSPEVARYRPVRVRTVRRALPTRVVSAVAIVNGTVWLILDPDKSEAAGDAAKTFVVTLLS